MLLGQLALIVAALFTGAALYVNVADQPARLRLNATSMLAEWKTAYKHGTAMQASLVVLGFLLGLLAWWETSDRRWLVGAVVLALKGPYTFIFITPTNRQILGINPDRGEPNSRALLENWGMLHAVRTILGTTATIILLSASMRY